LDLVAQGEPVARTARDLGISESCLRRWMERDAIDSGRKPGLTTDEHKELVELRRRLRVLEMENEILKRASDLITVSRSPRIGLRSEEWSPDGVSEFGVSGGVPGACGRVVSLVRGIDGGVGEAAGDLLDDVGELG
jgi:transposase-like protein